MPYKIYKPLKLLIMGDLHAIPAEKFEVFKWDFGKDVTIRFLDDPSQYNEIKNVDHTLYIDKNKDECMLCKNNIPLKSRITPIY